MDTEAHAIERLRVYVTGHRDSDREHIEEAAGYALARGALSVRTALDSPEVGAVVESDAVVAGPSAAECPDALADLAVAGALVLPRFWYLPDAEHDFGPLVDLDDEWDTLVSV